MIIIVVLVTGEVRYARNGHYVTTLMHVDTSLPLWAFLDIYGSMKEIKSIGNALCEALVALWLIFLDFCPVWNNNWLCICLLSVL